jgi:ABC-type spermidine/putrescine transport system permease subunit I
MNSGSKIAEPGEPVPNARRAWSPVAGPWIGLGLAAPLIALIGLFVIYPLLHVIIASAEPGDPFANYRAFISDRTSSRVLANTIRLSAVVTILAIGLGGIVAWTLRTTTSRWMRLTLWVAVLVPFWMGVVVKNYAFTIVLGRRGILNSVVQVFFGPDADLRLLYTETAVVIGMLYSMLPYAVLPLFVAFLTIDLELPKAAQSLGASRVTALRTVVLPLALPGILATASIVFVISIGFYITPILLGGPRSLFMATYINDEIFRLFNFPSAATSAVVLSAVAIGTLLVAWRVLGGERLRRAIG